MKLDEAIKHAKEKASNLRAMDYMDKEQARQCWLCAEEHDQLAGWLEELLSWRKKALSTIDIVTCKDCKHIDRTICLTSFPEKYGCKLGNGAHRLDFFCSYGERGDNNG